MMREIRLGWMIRGRMRWIMREISERDMMVRERRTMRVNKRAREREREREMVISGLKIVPDC